MKKLFILIFVLLIFLYLIIYDYYFRQNFVYKEELNAYYPEVVLIEAFEDNFYKSYNVNIQGLFYSKRSEFGMPIFIANKLDDVHGSTIGYYEIGYYKLYENQLSMPGIDVKKYKLNYNDKNQGLELFYFSIEFDIRDNQDSKYNLKYKYILEEIIKNKKINVFRYQRKDMMEGTIYISDPFIINFNDEQINNLNAIYNEIF